MLHSSHFIVFVITKEKFFVWDSRIRFSREKASGELRFQFCSKKKFTVKTIKAAGAVFNKYRRNNRVSFDFPENHPEKIRVAFKEFFGCEMTKSFVMPTKEKAKLDAYKACLCTRLVGTRKFEVIKTLQLSNYGCWQAALRW